MPAEFRVYDFRKNHECLRSDWCTPDEFGLTGNGRVVLQKPKADDEYALDARCVARFDAEELTSGVACDECQPRVIGELCEMLLQLSCSDAVMLFDGHTM